MDWMFIHLPSRIWDTPKRTRFRSYWRSWLDGSITYGVDSFSHVARSRCLEICKKGRMRRVPSSISWMERIQANPAYPLPRYNLRVISNSNHNRIKKVSIWSSPWWATTTSDVLNCLHTSWIHWYRLIRPSFSIWVGVGNEVYITRLHGPYPFNTFCNVLNIHRRYPFMNLGSFFSTLYLTHRINNPNLL